MIEGDGVGTQKTKGSKKKNHNWKTGRTDVKGEGGRTRAKEVRGKE